MPGTTFPYGDMIDISKDQHISTVTTRMYNKFKSLGKFGGIYVSTRPVALLTDLDLIKSVVIKDFDKFVNKGHYYNEKVDPASGNFVKFYRFKSFPNRKFFLQPIC